MPDTTAFYGGVHICKYKAQKLGQKFGNPQKKLHKKNVFFHGFSTLGHVLGLHTAKFGKTHIGKLEWHAKEMFFMVKTQESR